MKKSGLFTEKTIFYEKKIRRSVKQFLRPPNGYSFQALFQVSTAYFGPERGQ
jgi:hypothetical protein